MPRHPNSSVLFWFIQIDRYTAVRPDPGRSDDRLFRFLQEFFPHCPEADLRLPMSKYQERNSIDENYNQETSERFFNAETTGGLLLILATIVALIVANTGWAEGYHRILEEHFAIGLVDRLEIDLTVKEWVNDGLMVIFFLVAGLELKREVMVGELSTRKKAAMPLLGALGGMVVPAAIFFIFNSGTDTTNGWAIPMATDIAYSLGIVAMLGKRVPVALKIFLTALAIADDLGAILVIAFFYSDNIAWVRLAVAAGLFISLLAINRFGIKHLALYSVLGIAFWICFIHSGVHPTIAGVLFALTIPIKPRIDSLRFREKVSEQLEKLEKANLGERHPVKNESEREVLQEVRRKAKYSQPPLLRFEYGLTGFNAFFVIPLFALANAGVKLDVSIGEVFADSLGLGIIMGLFVGKILGVGIFTYAGHKLGLAGKNKSMSWMHILGVGMIAGVGFTMSLFITNLAFTDDETVKMAKISILIASFAAAVAGVVLLLMANRNASNRPAEAY
jgi:NhaA family Na+:H+ antiporter